MLPSSEASEGSSSLRNGGIVGLTMQRPVQEGTASIFPHDHDMKATVAHALSLAKAGGLRAAANKT
eukprot:5239357-Amphidinium_carterae.1